MMLTPDHWPQAIFGGPLLGNRALRFVYVDEAGTYANDPFTMVVGVVVNADEQLVDAEAAIREVVGAVPEAFRRDFYFHATDIWNNVGYRDEWSFGDRKGLLNRMMSLPRRLNIPIALGMVRRMLPLPKEGTSIFKNALQFQHTVAFMHCIARADKFIRDYADLREVGTVVAEDLPEMRRFLKRIPRQLRENPFVVPPDLLVPTQAERTAGYIGQETDTRVSRIRDVVHFVEKGDEPMLQLADACAFGMRRFFMEQNFGVEFGHSIFGERLPPVVDFASLISGRIFRWRPG